MTRYVTLATTLVSLVLSYPDAPLYSNNVAFSFAPLIPQSAQPLPHFVTRTFNNGAFTLQNSASPNPALFVAAQGNQVNSASPQTPTAASVPQRGVFQVISEGAPSQSTPRNFFTFTRTSFRQFAEAPADPQQSVPRNFVAFTRAPTQQVVQSPAEPAPSSRRNFVTVTRTPPHQYVGPQTAVAPQTNRQQPNQAQHQFGLRLAPALAEESASAVNPQPTPRPGVRPVILFSPQQPSAQSAQIDPKPRGATPLQFAPQPAKPRAVPGARPGVAVVRPQLSKDTQRQPLVVSSSQFFTRNFGSSGAVTYFIQPLSTRVDQAAPSIRESPSAEAR